MISAADNTDGAAKKHGLRLNIRVEIYMSFADQ